MKITASKFAEQLERIKKDKKLKQKEEEIVRARELEKLRRELGKGFDKSEY